MTKLVGRFHFKAVGGKSGPGGGCDHPVGHIDSMISWRRFPLMRVTGYAEPRIQHISALSTHQQLLPTGMKGG